MPSKQALICMETPSDDLSPSFTTVTKLYTLEEVASILRVDPVTCRRWVQKGLVEVVILPQTGHRTVVRISQRVLDRLLTEQLYPQ